MNECADCGHDWDDHIDGERWCTASLTVGQGGGTCDCSEYIDPDEVVAA